ncbi:MAG: helix-turn-helix transcriptional regulator [Acidobacteria bacterium]|nr:helix-turn-helix transcriptional regulator [Acidobacteriota bacterium]
MVYFERSPNAAALAPFVKSFWYCRSPQAPQGRQVILPSGHMQVVISLGGRLTDCSGGLHAPASPQDFAVLTGIYSKYMVIDTADLFHLAGVVFHPGGTAPFFSGGADLFTNLETSLEAIWGVAARSLRDRLGEAATPAAKLETLETSLLDRLAVARSGPTDSLVHYALDALREAPATATVAELSRSTGYSTRYLSQRFSEHVGVSPKLYSRILRFQRSVQQLHRGADIPWAELALSCGYYDQSHFANDFREFSGISPTTYSRSTRPWSNHIALG